MPTPPKTPRPADLTRHSNAGGRAASDLRTLEALGEYIELSLEALEQRFLSYQTRSSYKRSLRRGGDGATFTER